MDTIKNIKNMGSKKNTQNIDSKKNTQEVKKPYKIIVSHCIVAYNMTLTWVTDEVEVIYGLIEAILAAYNKKGFSTVRRRVQIFDIEEDRFVIG